MKKIGLLLIFGLLSVLFSGCNVSVVPIKPGKIQTITKDVNNFNSIDIRSAMQAHITISDVEEVIVEAGENLLQYLVVEVVNNVLKIHYNKSISIQGASPVIHIKMKDLRTVKQSGATTVTLNSNGFNFSTLNFEISGASKFSAKNLTANTFNLGLSGASNFDCSEFVAQNCVFDGSGASKINLKNGTSENLKLNLSGASSFKDFGFVSQYADLNLSGASRAELTVEKELSVIASGASKFYYKGNPVMRNIEVSGASQIVKK